MECLGAIAGRGNKLAFRRQAEAHRGCELSRGGGAGFREMRSGESEGGRRHSDERSRSGHQEEAEGGGLTEWTRPVEMTIVCTIDERTGG